MLYQASQAELAAFLADAKKFVETFQTTIMKSAPHIYLSALPFAPHRSMVSRHFLPQFPQTLKADISPEAGWPFTVALFEGHNDGVTSIAYSPDGRHIVSGSDDSTIRVWNAETGDLMGGPLEGHTKSVTSVAYSPDGRHIVSGSIDNTVRVWNAETGDLMGAPLEGHTDCVTSVAYSPDGRHIVSGSHDNTIRVWNAETGNLMGAPLEGHTGSLTSVAYSPAHRHVVFDSADNIIQVCNAATADFVEGHLDRNSGMGKFATTSAHANHIVTNSIGTSMQASSLMPGFAWRPNLDNGWICGSQSEFLFWVPPDCRLGLLEPNNTIIIGAVTKTRLDISRFVHGSQWTQCST